MLMPKVTGTMIRAGRIFAHLSQEQLAVRAGVSRDSIRTWEGSSDAAPGIQYRVLCRLTDALEAEGVRFRSDGVFVERATPISTVLHSEHAA